MACVWRISDRREPSLRGLYKKERRIWVIKRQLAPVTGFIVPGASLPKKLTKKPIQLSITFITKQSNQSEQEHTLNNRKITAQAVKRAAVWKDIAGTLPGANPELTELFTKRGRLPVLPAQ
jgi:hypothetical protein